MNYSFDSTVASEAGVNGAIILQNFYYWISYNKARGINLQDGKYWTYNTVSSLTKIFPFWSRGTIERELTKLKNNGFLETGCFNKLGCDRTTWYTFTEKGWELFAIAEHQNELAKSKQEAISQNQENELPKTEESISRNQENDLSKSRNAFHEIERPIPDNKQQIINTDNKQHNKREVTDVTSLGVAEPPKGDSEKTSTATKWTIREAREYVQTFPVNDEVRDTLIDYLDIRVRKKQPITKRALDGIMKKLADEPPRVQQFMLDETITNGWMGIFKPKPYQYREIMGQSEAYEIPRGQPQPQQESRRERLMALAREIDRRREEQGEALNGNWGNGDNGDTDEVCRPLSPF